MIEFAVAAQVAQKIAGVDEDGSFRDYVRSVVHSRAMIQFWVLLGSGFFGMAANYAYKWLRDEIRGSLWHYLARQHTKATLLAFATFVGYALTTVISPVLDGAGWSVVINLGLTTGFAIDALVNKADRQAWTDEERAERKRKLEKSDPNATLPPPKNP